MTDIVERLRKQAHEARYSTMPPECAPCVDPDTAEEAAAEITRLRARVAELEEGLKPFAARAALYDPVEDDDNEPDWSQAAPDIRIGDLRQARSLTKGGE